MVSIQAPGQQTAQQAAQLFFLEEAKQAAAKRRTRG
jgi:hypothetical protein